MDRYHIFDTAFGLCGVAWSRQGLTCVQLPEGDRQAMERRLQKGIRQECTDDLPIRPAQAVAKLRQYFIGEHVDFSDLPLDLGASGAFHDAVYRATRSVPWGGTATYGELARKIGSPDAARAVGNALARNPIAVIIPCHRILAAGGKIGGFSAYGGVSSKERLLGIEGLCRRSDASRLSHQPTSPH